MTLTTCNPRWASYERLIFHAKLIETLPKGEGRPAALRGWGVMYAWIWRHLPGPVAVRLLVALVLLAVVVVLLFGWVFPWVEPRLPFTDVTVEPHVRRR